MKKTRINTKYEELKKELLSTQNDLDRSRTRTTQLESLVRTLRELFPTSSSYGRDTLHETELLKEIVGLVMFRTRTEGIEAAVSMENRRLWELVQVYAKDPRIEVLGLTEEERNLLSTHARSTMVRDHLRGV